LPKKAAQEAGALAKVAQEADFSSIYFDEVVSRFVGIFCSIYDNLCVTAKTNVLAKRAAHDAMTAAAGVFQDTYTAIYAAVTKAGVSMKDAATAAARLYLDAYTDAYKVAKVMVSQQRMLPQPPVMLRLLRVLSVMKFTLEIW
jgi:hypothetical protein